MAIDPAQIELTKRQKERLANLAEREGKGYAQVLDELLSSAPLVSNGIPLANCDPDNLGPDNLSGSQQTAYDALAAIGAIGCIKAPPDLSTNPKYMEGFGTNAKRTDSD